MTIGSATADVHMINIALTAADGSGANWQDPTQMIPLGMNGNPEAFVAAIKTGLPQVNNLRVLFNEYSFNPDGSMNPQVERFLAAAAAQGFKLTICYGGGDAQRIGIGDATHPALSNAQAYAALQQNYGDVAGAWTRMMDWMDHHTAVESSVYGWELMNESAGYKHSIRANGADATYSVASFVELYAKHTIALSNLIKARAEGNILVGGWGYNGDFLSLAAQKIGAVSALDYLRAGVGAELVWSAHLYPGWMGTTTALSPAALQARLNQIYAPVAGDNVLLTEMNLHGTVDDPTKAVDFIDAFAGSLDWFAANGIGLGWFPGVQEGASHLLYVETNGSITYRHQHSLAHALDGYSLGMAPASGAASQVIQATLVTARLRNETYEITAGEALFDSVTKMGRGFGFGGNDTLRGSDLSNDFLYGGSGNDSLTGAGADDFLFGQSGNDAMFGGLGHDNLFGGLGNDYMDAGAGRNTLHGGKGDDTYIVRSAQDAITEYANEGTDLVKTTLSALSLATGLPTRFGAIENLTYLGSGRFTGTGNALNNTLTGGNASDSLSGGAGSDTLIGRGGADRLDGGTGSDTASYLTAAARVVAALSPGYLAVSAGDARGDVFVSVENLQGSNFGDILRGDAAANRIYGMAGADALSGGAGNDLLYGGLGADRFVFTRGCDSDHVMDFADNLDTVVFSGFGMTSVSAGMAHARQVGANVVFDFGQGDVMTVHNITKAALFDDVVFL